MMFHRSRLFPLVFAVFALAGAAFLQGCSDQARNLTNSGQPANEVQTRPKAAGKLGLGDLIENTVRLADGIVLNPNSKVETDTEVFDFYHSGKLWVYFGNYADYWGGEVQVKEATFLVDQYAVPPGRRDVDITMTVYSGYCAEDIVVKFDPSGLEFRWPVTLKLKLRGKNVSEDMEAYHAHDGKVEQVEVTYEEHDGLLEKYVIVTIKVPGFSEYSLGGDDWYEPEAETY